MAVTIKSAREIELMREAGRLLEIVHDEMAKIIRPGISTMEINELLSAPEFPRWTLICWAKN